MGSSHSAESQDVNSVIASRSSTQGPPYPRKLDDAIKTFNILRHLLPSELVLEVLQFAEYWLCDTVQRKETISYNQTSFSNPIPYLTSQPLPEGRLEEIRINIWSHDQGWSSYREDHGTYRNSWTWFELEIERPEGADSDPEAQTIRLATNVHAQKQETHHEIIYQRGEEFPWMDLLKPGECISIMPLARFHGWTNTVLEASIEIYTAPIL